MRKPLVLTLGTTPCPNDSYLLGAVATGALTLAGVDLVLEHADIETLNERTLAGDLDIAKISCAVYATVAADYVLLDTGAALAETYGPLVLARAGYDAGDLDDARIVVPGAHTTAALLFRHWAGRALPVACLPYDRIIAALVLGQADIGVIIHESRFTFDAAGLRCLADLGVWWQATRALPVPLGCYVIRRTLYERHGAAIEQLMRCSLRLAAGGDAQIAAYIRAHAQELDDEVIRRHIELYVNRHTYVLGERGRLAIAALGAALAQPRVASA